MPEQMFSCAMPVTLFVSMSCFFSLGRVHGRQCFDSVRRLDQFSRRPREMAGECSRRWGPDQVYGGMAHQRLGLQDDKE